MAGISLRPHLPTLQPLPTTHAAFTGEPFHLPPPNLPTPNRPLAGSLALLCDGPCLAPLKAQEAPRSQAQVTMSPRLGTVKSRRSVISGEKGDRVARMAGLHQPNDQNSTHTAWLHLTALSLACPGDGWEPGHVFTSTSSF